MKKVGVCVAESSAPAWEKAQLRPVGPDHPAALIRAIW